MKRVAEACGVLYRRPAPAARSFKFLTLISLVRVRCSAWDKFEEALRALLRGNFQSNAHQLISFLPPLLFRACIRKPYAAAERETRSSTQPQLKEAPKRDASRNDGA